MSCACGCGSCGLGRNLDLSILGRTRRGLRGLGDTPNLEYVKAGSQVRVGFRYSSSTGYDPVESPEDVKAVVEKCLYESDAYTSVNVAVSTGFVQDYMTIGVIPRIDFSRAEDIAGQIQGAIGQCYPQLAAQIDGHDRVQVAPPAGSQSAPGQNPSTPVGSFQASPEEQKKAEDKKDQCLIDPKSGKEREGLDYLSCKLGLGGSSGGSGGLILAIIAAVVIAKAFK